MFSTAAGSFLQIEDVDGVRIQAEFSRFIKLFVNEDGSAIYRKAIESLTEAERNTLIVDMRHVHSYSSALHETIALEFYRMYPYICEALRLAAIDACTHDVN
ncbi:hypothetical protein KIN20_021308 [Parelaphostrongylus tenuis]|uniref:MCM N-terminal domain-containing protein n=1 Tax=Parelaphostrongylus tenuis TaxID=148309 RepID=A0AAD5MTZ0_PARTN|nr:hypothetical protein KIN20_021308 [Parelaphostrongylus tenuis]